MKISDHIPYGKHNAVGTDYLKAVTGLDTRTIRKLIANERMQGTVICSSLLSEGGGYFRPESPAEAVHYVRTEQCRIESASKALASAQAYIKDAEYEM